MKIFTGEHIRKSYGEKVLFDNIAFSMKTGDRIGLIGINGTGKSTLLKIIAQKEEVDSGKMIKSKDYTISYLSQNPTVEEENTVLEQIFQGAIPVLQLIRTYEEALLQLEVYPKDAKVQNHLFATQQKMDTANAWETSTNMKAMLTKLGITDMTAKMKHLSGGQRKRVAMAQCFAEQPDLLILDEPTNHLDHETVEWLEQYLARYQGTLLFVTHDRYFLDRVANRMIELDGGKLHFYEGNYSTFLSEKAVRVEQAVASEQKRQSLYRRELAWIRRGAKARTTKQKARIDRFKSLEQTAAPAEKERVDISLSSNRLGKKVLELKKVSKSFAEKTILQNFTYIVQPESRIGIIGKNGTGKSTLLNILAGKITPDNGEVEIGQTVKIAYYTQETEAMDSSMRMITYLQEVAEVVHTTDGKALSASQMLERSLFPKSMHGTPIGKLSGGERRRLYLLRLLMTEPNVLLLDEPTNDLDTQTLTVLEEYLETFPGVVITVSHDRYFLDKVVDELLILSGDGQITHYFGAYTDWLAKAKEIQVEAPSKVEKEPAKPKEKKRRLSYQEKKDWETIEEDIMTLEAQLEEVTDALNNVGADFTKAAELSAEQEQLEVEIEAKMNRWEELSELIASLEE